MRSQILVVILIHTALVWGGKNGERQEYVQIREDYGTPITDQVNESNEHDAPVIHKKQDSNGYYNLNYRQNLGFQPDQSGRQAQQNNGAQRQTYSQEVAQSYQVQNAQGQHTQPRQQQRKIPVNEQHGYIAIPGSNEGFQTLKIPHGPQLAQSAIQFINPFEGQQHKQVSKGVQQGQTAQDNGLQNNKYAYYAQKLEADLSTLYGQTVPHHHQQQQQQQQQQQKQQNNQHVVQYEDDQSNDFSYNGYQLQDNKYKTQVQQPQQSVPQGHVAYGLPQNNYHVPAHEQQVQQHGNIIHGSYKIAHQIEQNQQQDNSAYDLYKNKQIVELIQHPVQQEYRKTKHQEQQGQNNNIQANNFYKLRIPQGPSYTQQIPQGDNGIKDYQNKYIQYVVQSAQKLLQGNKHIAPYAQSSEQSNSIHQGNYGNEQKYPTQGAYVTNTIKVPYPPSYQAELENKVPSPITYPVKAPVHRPHTVNVPKPFPVHLEQPVPYTVEKPVPYSVGVPYDVQVPVKAPQAVPYTASKAVPYQVPVYVVVEKPVSIYVKDQQYPQQLQHPVPQQHQVQQQHHQQPQQQLRNSYSSGGHKNIQAILSHQQGSSGASQSQHNAYNGRH